MQEAVKQFIDYALKEGGGYERKDCFKALFDNQFISDQLTQNDALKNHFINTVKIEFENSPFGAFTLLVNNDNSYSHKIEFNEETLKNKLQNLNQPEAFDKLADDLNKIFGNNRNKGFDTVNVIYELKSSEGEGNEIQLKFTNIKLKVFLTRLSTALMLIGFGLLLTGLLGVKLLPLMIVAGVALTIGIWILAVHGVLMGFWIFKEPRLNAEGKLKGFLEPYIANSHHLKNLAQICQEAIDKTNDINSFLPQLDDSDFYSFNKGKMQFFKQWNNNVAPKMSKYFKVQEKVRGA